ncbi:MAG TPA: DNA polymerase III subunit delta' [Kaistia sp.]|nr:DNA polymerase III subunit delta' [Kaistia sp.]
MAVSPDLPQLDALEGWPSPEEQADWYGATSDERLLVDAYRGGRMHHAWLITGPRGSGKATLAYRFARFALAHPDPARAPAAESLAIDPGHPVARKIVAHAHPNLLTLARPYDDKNKRFKESVTVDEVRRTIPFFGATAGEAGWRIAIVDAADDLNASAANALLKILEEPPRGALFFVLSHAPGRLLPTIRSRCRRLDLTPLGSDAIERALERHSDAGPEERRFAALAGEGSIRRAVRFLDDEVIAIGSAFGRAVGRFPALDVGAAHRLGDIVAQRGADDAFESFQDLVFDWLARRARGLPEPETLGALPPVVAAVPLARWAEVWEKVRQSSAEVEALNLDRKQYVLTTIDMLARATRM